MVIIEFEFSHGYIILATTEIDFSYCSIILAVTELGIQILYFQICNM